MSTNARQESPRYATVRDYLRVVRRHRLMIAIIALAFAAAAFVLTDREKVTYQAQASVYFQDTTQEVNLLGTTTVMPTLSDSARAQINAREITSAPVVEEVKRELGSNLSVGALAGAISTFVDSQTDIVVIQATSSDRQYAQRLANAFATAVQRYGRQQARSQFTTLASSAQAQLAQLSATARDSFTRSVYANRIATLDFLAQTADPVRIISTAALPAGPSGPRTVRNALLGLLLGLTVGLIAAFVRDILDHRLRGVSEIGERLGWPVLGHVRDSAFTGPVFPHGADNGKPAGEEGDRESFRILRQNIRMLDVDNSPRSVVVTSGVSEEGKSTVAASLACASAIAGTRTLLVECDLRRPSLAGRLGLASAPGLADYLIGDASPSDVVQVLDLARQPSQNGAIAVGATNGASTASGTRTNHTILAVDERQGHAEPFFGPRRLACITGGRRAPETAELLSSERFKSFLDEVTSIYDLVVLDTGPLLSVADTTVLLPQAEATLVCIRAGKTTEDEAMALKQAIERLPHRHIGVVVTGVPAGTEEDFGCYSYEYAHG